MNTDGMNAEATDQTSAPQTMADIASTVKEGSTQSENQTQQTPNEADNVSDFQNFVAQSNTRISELEAKVTETSKAHNELVNSQHRDTVNKEINSAAESINKAAGGDSDMARLYLESQYQKDPSLQKVWDNRRDNPEALEQALGVLSTEWAAKNKNTIDPQVAENQRALQESQQSGGTVQKSDLTTELSKLSDGEFMSAMRRMRSS